MITPMKKDVVSHVICDDNINELEFEDTKGVIRSRKLNKDRQ